MIELLQSRQEAGGRHEVFEGIPLQWDKRQWTFTPSNEETAPSTKDVYSVWNPQYWPEIAQRLATGEKCAMMIAGSFGVGMVFEAPSWQKEYQPNSQFNKLREVKKGREKGQNYVAFIDPDDQIDVMDINRLPATHKNLRWADSRLKSYAWAQHNIFPANITDDIDPALYKEKDKSIACFWIPGHWGFEGIAREMKKIKKHGIFGGGSLNYHGEQPSFTAEDLRKQMANRPDWQEQLDFVIIDELVESAAIQRSQPMVSFMESRPLLLRRGSVSLNAIRQLTGYPIEEHPSITNASSSTPYDDISNHMIDERVDGVRSQIDRFKKVVRP